MATIGTALLDAEIKIFSALWIPIMTCIEKPIGSRAEVFHGTARKTGGGLRRCDLKRHGDRIVSRKASAAAKKGPGFKALKKGGYVVGKGIKPLFGKTKKKK